jgi:hypothetical protein
MPTNAGPLIRPGIMLSGLPFGSGHSRRDRQTFVWRTETGRTHKKLNLQVFQLISTGCVGLVQNWGRQRELGSFSLFSER